MTWVSERSGIASSGVRRRARVPQAAKHATRITVVHGRPAHTAMRRPRRPTWRSVASMARSLGPQTPGGFEPTLGGDEEVARRHDALAFLETAADLVAEIGAHAEVDLAWLQATVPHVDEDDAAWPRVEDGLDGDEQAFAMVDREDRVDIGLGAEREAGVVEDHAGSARARRRIDRRVDVI